MTESTTGYRSIKRALLFAAVVVIAGGVHHGVIGAPFNFDDFHMIRKNPAVRDSANLLKYWTDTRLFSIRPAVRMYRPVTMTSYLFNYLCNRYRPAGWHLVNLLLHLLNVLLVILVSRLILGNDIAAAVVGLFFGCHPVGVETSAYLSARSGMLATAFGLGALLCAGWESRVSIHRLRPMLLSALLFFLALGSKENAASFAAIPFLFAVTAGRREERSRWLRVGMVWTALLCFYLAWRKWGLDLTTFPSNPDRPLGPQLMGQASVWVHYIRLLFLPWNISLIYNMKRVEGLFDAPSAGMLPPWAAILLLAILAAVAAANVRKNPPLFIGLGWFLLTLVPESVVPLNQVANDRRLYFPMIGLIVAAVGVGGAALRTRAKAWGALPVTAAVLFSLMAAARVDLWRSNLSLWTDSVRRSPLTPATWLNLGRHYVDIDMTDKAIKAYWAAYLLKPDNPLLMNNVGVILVKNDRLDEAAHLYSLLVKKFPDYYLGWLNMGLIRYSQGKYTEAEKAFKKVIELVPDYALAHLNLGKTYLELDNTEGAGTEFNKALELDPELMEARQNLDALEKGESRKK